MPLELDKAYVSFLDEQHAEGLGSSENLSPDIMGLQTSWGGQGRLTQESAQEASNGGEGVKEAPMGDRFWDEVALLQAGGRLEEGTMFGFRCVRAGKAFVAMPGHQSDGMVVKLPAQRVAELLDSGRGRPVAPAGKVFKEWVEIIPAEEWGPFLEEALDFAGG